MEFKLCSVNPATSCASFMYSRPTVFIEDVLDCSSDIADGNCRISVRCSALIIGNIAWERDLTCVHQSRVQSCRRGKGAGLGSWDLGLGPLFVMHDPVFSSLCC